MSVSWFYETINTATLSQLILIHETLECDELWVSNDVNDDSIIINRINRKQSELRHRKLTTGIFPVRGTNS